MILDIGQLRHRDAHKDLIEIATRYSLPFLEQDAWNLYCQGEWFELDSRWNVNLMAYTDSALSGDLWSREVLESPFVVHFCGKPKPWDCKLRLPWAEQYYELLASTRWKGRFPKNESAERIEAEKCVFGFKVRCRSTESSRRRGETERRFLPRLQRALVDSSGTITTDLRDLRSVLVSPEFTTALDFIEQRAKISRDVYDRFDPKVFLNEICRELSASQC
jgi:lipopolysaccharide biosynthesis glycosyltransferase